MAGGTTVTIIGNNFQAGASVTFGGVAAPTVNVIGNSVLTAVTPSMPAGALDVVVTNPDGQSATLPQAFTSVAPPVPSADLYDSLSGPAGDQTPGSTITISLDLGNLGPNSADNVVYTMTLADGLSFGPGAPCQIDAQHASCNVGSLGVTTFVVAYPVSIQIAAGDTGPYTITSSFTSDTLDLNTANNTATFQIDTPPPPPPPSADLYDSLSGPAGDQTPGSTITISLDLGNLGPNSADNVVYTMTLADGLSFGPGAPCQIDAQHASCNVGSLGVTTFVVAYPVSIQIAADTGPYTITSSFTSDTLDLNTANNTATFQIDTPPPPPPPSADLYDSLSGPAGVQTPGSTITISLDLGNLGPNSADNVVYTMTLADGLSFGPGRPARSTPSTQAATSAASASPPSSSPTRSASRSPPATPAPTPSPPASPATPSTSTPPTTPPPSRSTRRHRRRRPRLISTTASPARPATRHPAARSRSASTSATSAPTAPTTSSTR